MIRGDAERTRVVLRVGVVDAVNDLCRAYGIGFDIHVGETVLGIKGRVGFEAGAALLLIRSHRELEKLVATKWQLFWKDQLGRFYGDRLHEGQYFDPSCRDIEAFLTSSQQRVVGETRVRLSAGRFQVTGTRSPYSMMSWPSSSRTNRTSRFFIPFLLPRIGLKRGTIPHLVRPAQSACPSHERP